MKLETVAKAEGLHYIVVADTRTGRVEQTSGSPGGVEQGGLVSALTGGPSVIVRLASSLDGQLLPQAWAQGKVVAYATLVRDTVIVAFCETPGEPLEMYEKGLRLQKLFESSFEER